ncbi:hypothetical protein DCC81_03435 [Chitinophaga parva]|uniref:Crp/Fnr family transcriptional regulator n=1 Tax=Chitinophaga parva TaxID=2169414 RepID=A0A2T7BLI3_9BACT|nr:Crp/Fnr family transcriptional regulator [Chitinophaga parva]PUZ28547.1 hypothetical protein DCC81_03435 [Chitinophaga parva]
MDNTNTYLLDFFSSLQKEGRVFSTQFRKHLQDLASVEDYGCRQQLQRKGTEVKHVWYVLEGALRTRNFYDKKDQDVTSCLWFPGQWAGVFTHLFSSTRSDRVIEAITDSVVIRFPFAELLAIRMQFPEEWMWVAGSMIEMYIRSCDYRHEQMITLSARERYQQLLGEHPEVFQMIKQQEIASYLNISREELSRLRAVRS